MGDETKKPITPPVKPPAKRPGKPPVQPAKQPAVKDEKQKDPPAKKPVSKDEKAKAPAKQPPAKDEKQKAPPGKQPTKKPDAPADAPGKQPDTPAAPPAQRPDFLVSNSSDPVHNCRTALLFPNNAPLTSQAVEGPDRRAKPPVGFKRKGLPDATTLDLQAVWTHVTQTPQADGVDILVFLHGNGTFVTIDASGACAWPSWLHEDVKPSTASTNYDPKAKAHTCAAGGYHLIESAKKYKNSLVMIVPENAKPLKLKSYKKKVKKVVDGVEKEVIENKSYYDFGIPATLISNQKGSLDQPDTLGNLIDECLKRLTTVKAPADRTQCPGPPLKTVPKIRRLFLSGHSGAGPAIYACAKSNIVKKVRTDLMLLDCFYWNGSDAIREFVKSANGNGGLGNEKENYRIILAHNPNSYDADNPDSFPNTVPAAREQKDKYIDVQFKGGKDRLETARDAMKQFPVVIISSTSFGHYKIPEEIIALVLETAK